MTVSRAFGIRLAAAMAISAVLVWFGFRVTESDHVTPKGLIGKVRVQKVTDDVTFIVIDFNLRNDSDMNMVVRSIRGSIETPAGTVNGSSVAASDLVEAFHDYPGLGEQYNKVLKERDIVPPHQTLDRMAGIRFDLPAEAVEARRAVTLSVEDVTGPVLEMKK